jgi:membrane protein DedA with SNARE-associated domain
MLSRLLPVWRAVVPPFAGVAGVPAWRAIVPMAAASAIYYGGLTFLIATLGTNFEVVTRFLGRANLVLGVVALVLLVLFARWTIRRLKR